MEYFFCFDKDIPDGVGIANFGLEHIIWLLIAVICCTMLALRYKRARVQNRRKMRVFVGLALLVLEAGKVLALWLTGFYGLYYLPLHLCGIAIYLTLWHSLRGGDILGQMLYCVCMPGAAFALVFPDWLFYPALNYLSITSFLLHILLVAYPVMLLAGGELRPEPKRLPICFLILLVLAAAVYAFDLAFSTNYMFLLNPAPDSPLEWFYRLWGGGWYVLGYIPLLAGVWLLLYLPLALFRRKKKF